MSLEDRSGRLRFGGIAHERSFELAISFDGVGKSFVKESGSIGVSRGFPTAEELVSC